MQQLSQLSRHFTTSPPPASSFRSDKPSLLIIWWCTLYALIIILFRVIGRYIRTEKIFLDDLIMMLAAIPLLVHVGFENLVILYGTNNVVTTGFDEAQTQSREFGSKMVLISRVFYATYLWTIKFSITNFLRTLIRPIWQRFHHRYLHHLHYFLLFTYIFCIAATLMPCQPFHNFWQVTPDPGPLCRQNDLQLLTVGILDMLTNLVLVFLPTPLIWRSSLPSQRKFTTFLRLLLPSLPNILTLYSLLYLTTVGHNTQSTRSLFAALEILLTTISANAVVLASLLQDRGYKKTKGRHVRELLEVKKTQYQNHNQQECGLNLMDAGGLLDVKSVDSVMVTSMTKTEKKVESEVECEIQRDESELRNTACEDLEIGHNDTQYGVAIEMPPPVRFGDINVAQSWEIRIEDIKSGSGRGNRSVNRSRPGVGVIRRA